MNLYLNLLDLNTSRLLLLNELELTCENQNFRAADLLILAGAEIPKSLLDACVLSIKPESAGGLVPDVHQEEFASFQQEAISKLMHTIFHGELSMVQLLLHLGVNVNEKGGNGWTVLMCAAHDGKVECVRILTAAGADINILDDDRASAIYLASHENEFSRKTMGIWDCFLDKGVDIQRDF
uniref:Uncharacterized protein n=1 Tax=Bionectria ochroleuca TaxID=29856 RepID=A0A8H7NHH0_BIOOC